MTATDIVKDLYDKFPEVYFINEHELDDNKIQLIFQINQNDVKLDLKALEALVKEYDVPYELTGNDLIIVAYDDTFTEDLMESQSLTEDFFDINNYKVGTYDYNDLDPYTNSERYSGPYVQYRVENALNQLKEWNPNIGSFLTMPSDDEIAHIVKAYNKVKSQGEEYYKAGINVKAITDEQKFWHYFLVALAIPFPGYIIKARQAYAQNHSYRSGQSPTWVGIILYDSQLLKDIKARIPAIMDAAKAEQAEKEARKAAREQKKAAKEAEVTAQKYRDIASGKIKAPGTILQDAPGFIDTETLFGTIRDAGNDIRIKTFKMNKDFPSTQDSYWMDVTFNEGKNGDLDQLIKVDKHYRLVKPDELGWIPIDNYKRWMIKKLAAKEAEDIANAVADTEETDAVEDTVDNVVVEESLRDELTFDFDIARQNFEKEFPNSDITLDDAVEMFNKSEYAEKDFYAKPIYNERAWNKMLELVREKQESETKNHTTINIRESLNKIDLRTDNKYDLRNIYDSCILTENEKKSIARMIYENKSVSELYESLMGYYENN